MTRSQVRELAGEGVDRRRAGGHSSGWFLSCRLICDDALIHLAATGHVLRVRPVLRSSYEC